ncbi:hypothetical protein ZWY2020_009226 [Hordeum vulgare]|nr:hypothetical protein ZWY2020_009226 [Hordeum vulgare]
MDPPRPDPTGSNRAPSSSPPELERAELHRQDAPAPRYARSGDARVTGLWRRSQHPHHRSASGHPLFCAHDLLDVLRLGGLALAARPEPDGQLVVVALADNLVVPSVLPSTSTSDTHYWK